jgi:hypothetical protein
LHDGASAPGITYTVQAKPKGSERWQMLAIGLKSPSTGVDVNHFPGASGADVRVLQSDGFAEKEIFRDSKSF